MDEIDSIAELERILEEHVPEEIEPGTHPVCLMCDKTWVDMASALVKRDGQLVVETHLLSEGIVHFTYNGVFIVNGEKKIEKGLNLDGLMSKVLAFNNMLQ